MFKAWQKAGYDPATEQLRYDQPIGAVRDVEPVGFAKLYFSVALREVSSTTTVRVVLLSPTGEQISIASEDAVPNHEGCIVTAIEARNVILNGFGTNTFVLLADGEEMSRCQIHVKSR